MGNNLSMKSAHRFRSGIGLLMTLGLLAQGPAVVAGTSLGSMQTAQQTTTDPREATAPTDIVRRLQRRLEKSRSKTASPGAQAAVIRDGALVWFGQDGLAVRRPKKRVSEETLFYFASFGKMMLASFTLHQVEEGLLELDEPIQTYVGKSIPGSSRVTIRMLLSHTAGYPDIYSHPKVAPLFGKKYDPNRDWTFKRLFKGLRRPHDPGEKWAYSNTGYLVLLYVLREVISEPLPSANLDFLAPIGTIEPIDENSLAMRRSRKVTRRIAHGFVFNKKPPSDTFIGAETIPTDLFRNAVGRWTLRWNCPRRSPFPRRTPHQQPAARSANDRGNDYANRAIVGGVPRCRLRTRYRAVRCEPTNMAGAFRSLRWFLLDGLFGFGERGDHCGCRERLGA
jgi:hypothetical protein